LCGGDFCVSASPRSGRPRKPIDRAQGRRKRPALALVATVAVDERTPPSGLVPVVLENWRAFWRSDFAQLVNWERDHRALGRLFKLYSLRVQLEAAIEDENGVPQVLVVGSRKQEILNPALRHIATVDGEILQLEQQFGMTPRSAAALGMQIGGLKRTLDDLNREANDRAYRRKAPARKAARS
jgi:terminase small subunit-like protein